MPEDPYMMMQESSDEGSEPMDKGSEGESNKEVETALLPKSIFGDKDLEPGNKCTFEIVKVHGDEVEVKYSHESEPKEEEQTLEGGLDMLAKPYG